MASKTLTYSNPVYDGYFADPFVLRTSEPNGLTYYAYGTGHGPEKDGRQFPVLRSTDLVHWDYVGGALPPCRRRRASRTRRIRRRRWPSGTGGSTSTTRPPRATATRRTGCGWRSATGREGPFEDVGKVAMTGEYADRFSIDAHPFLDPRDGKWYLFFGTDFFTDRVGTGTAAVPLGDDMCSSAGDAAPVLRASAEWHVYERNRPLYGKVWDAWHTVEGPFVWQHGGKYYCFYSGGNWQTRDYGVGYGVADHALGPYRDEWNLEGPAVLKGVPDKILGPGHNSVTVGPDGVTEFVVYHAWDPGRTARRLCIDPLRWVDFGDGFLHPRCAGPTQGPQMVGG